MIVERQVTSISPAFWNGVNHVITYVYQLQNGTNFYLQNLILQNFIIMAHKIRTHDI